METRNKFPKDLTCYGCLRVNDEKSLHSYSLSNETLKAVFEMDYITLCFSCYERAEQAELFIKNVQRNQIQIQKLHKRTNMSLNTFKPQSQGLKNLTQVQLQPIELTGLDSNIQEPFCVYENCMETEDLKVKLEIEEDKDELLQHFDEEFAADDTGQTVKEEEDEDEYPLKLLKEEPELEEMIMTCLEKPIKKRKLKKKNKLNIMQEDRKSFLQLPSETITITREECIEERVKMAADKKYLTSEYKCTYCLKGFSVEEIYEKHMEKHNANAGDYECDICQQRTNSEKKLNRHKRCHSFRYRCRKCNLVRNTRRKIKEHYTSMHCDGLFQFTCPHCFKVFKTKRYLLKHKAFMHGPKQSVQCDYCKKKFRCKRSLQAHIIGRHSTRVGVPKRYMCQECGKAFTSPSHLRSHGIKHTEKRDYYCVECDKSFKSDNILKHHLKTTMPHTNYIELPYPCLHCDKRFAIKRDIERHTNRVHLNVKPYQCDQCERAYVNAWSLTDHKRLIHEGYKRPHKFPCTMCDKVFDRKSILKSHMRTHTGERPYQCSACPAQFTQSGVLRTHVKLIHLKLTRDGRPKVGSNGRNKAGN